MNVDEQNDEGFVQGRQNAPNFEMTDPIMTAKIYPTIDKTKDKQQLYRELKARDSKEAKIMLREKYAEALLANIEALVPKERREGGWLLDYHMSLLRSYLDHLVFSTNLHNFEKEKAKLMNPYNYYKLKYNKKTAYPCTVSLVQMQADEKKIFLAQLLNEQFVNPNRSTQDQFAQAKNKIRAGLANNVNYSSLQTNTTLAWDLEGINSIASLVQFYAYFYSWDGNELKSRSLPSILEKFDDNITLEYHGGRVGEYLIKAHGFASHLKHWGYRGYKLKHLKVGMSITNFDYEQIVIGVVASRELEVIQRPIFVIPRGQTLSISGSKFDVDDYLIITGIGRMQKGQTFTSDFKTVPIKFWVSSIMEAEQGVMVPYNPNIRMKKPELNKFDLTQAKAVIGVIQAKDGIAVYNQLTKLNEAKGFAVTLYQDPVTFKKPEDPKILDNIKVLQSSNERWKVVNALANLIIMANDLTSDHLKLIQAALYANANSYTISVSTLNELRKKGIADSVIAMFLAKIGFSVEEMEFQNSMFQVLGKRPRLV